MPTYNLSCQSCGFDGRLTCESMEADFRCPLCGAVSEFDVAEADFEDESRAVLKILKEEGL